MFMVSRKRDSILILPFTRTYNKRVFILQHLEFAILQKQSSFFIPQLWISFIEMTALHMK